MPKMKAMTDNTVKETAVLLGLGLVMVNKLSISDFS